MPQSDGPRYIAFSGGGWNSHTASSGWVSGAYEAIKKKYPHLSNINVEQLFGNIAGITGNSGGSWFMTMLGYSEQFKTNLIENPEKWFDKSEGYMGQVKTIFDQADVDKKDQDSTGKVVALQIINSVLGDAAIKEKTRNKLATRFSVPIDQIINSQANGMLYGINMLQSITDDNSPNWLKATQDLVFEPFRMNELNSQRMEDRRLDWSKEKIFGITIAIPTEGVVVGGSKLGIDNDKSFLLGNAATSTRSVPLESLTSPGIIISDPHNDSNKVVFTANPGSYSYSAKDYLGVKVKQSDLKSPSFSKDLNNKLSVIEATAISSSAAGMLASSTFLDQLISNQLESPEFKETSRLIKDIQNQLNNFTQSNINLSQALSNYMGRYLQSLAIPASISNGNFEVTKTSSNSNLKNIADTSTYRYIDGGYVDNTSATSALHSIQNNNTKNKPFSLTILSNSTGGMASIQGKSEKLTITGDVKDLFGSEHSKELITKGFGNGIQLPTISPHIFDAEAWTEVEEPTWTYKSSDGNTKIQYFKLNVNTISNKLFGIEEGWSGELDVFINYNSKSDAAPFDQGIFEQYEDVFNTTRDSLQTPQGIKAAISALGLNIGIDGERKDDILQGNRFINTIRGGAGDDIIIGGNSKDILIGGEGSDVFQYNKISDSPDKKRRRDVVRNFNALDGDKIDLMRIGNIEFIAGDQFSGPNQARWNGQYLQVNTDNQNDAEMSIRITGNTEAISAENIIT